MKQLGIEKRKRKRYEIFKGIRISKSQNENMETVKQATGMSDSEIVREALSMYLGDVIHTLKQRHE